MLLVIILGNMMKNYTHLVRKDLSTNIKFKTELKQYDPGSPSMYMCLLLVNE